MKFIDANNPNIPVPEYRSRKFSPFLFSPVSNGKNIGIKIVLFILVKLQTNAAFSCNNGCIKIIDWFVQHRFKNAFKNRRAKSMKRFVKHTPRYSNRYCSKITVQ